MKRLRIDVWSDLACPWCYVGKRRLEKALTRFGHEDEIDLVWRAYELDPSAPRTLPTEPSYAERIAKKYGAPVAKAEEMMRRLVDVAASEGLAFRFDIARPGNTFDAHRVLHLAGERRVQDAVKERLFRAYLCEGEALGEPSALARLGAEAGLDAAEVGEVVRSERYAREVRAEEEQGRRLGISGVPCFVFDGRHGVVGAQSVEAISAVLDRVWGEVSSRPVLAEGATCGPEGCA